jgi:hypothetical protein
MPWFRLTKGGSYLLMSRTSVLELRRGVIVSRNTDSVVEAQSAAEPHLDVPAINGEMAR